MSWVASASAVWTEFATSSRRLTTDSVDNLKTDQTDFIAIRLREFWSIMITFLTMTSSCRHLSPTSIVQLHCCTGNCKPGHDCRRVRSHRRRESTRQLSRVGVGGVYWALLLLVQCLLQAMARKRRRCYVSTAALQWRPRAAEVTSWSRVSGDVARPVSTVYRWSSTV